MLDYESEELQSKIDKIFTEWFLEHFDELVSKHIHLVDKRIEERVNGGYTPELNTVYFNRIMEIVDTEVGNYLRTRESEILKCVYKTLDNTLEKEIENKVKWRVSKIMEKVGKSLENI